MPAEHPEPVPTLRQRMALAMKDIGRVGKNGRNEGQKYDYTKADDIITEVRGALLAHGIIFVSSEKAVTRLPDRESRNGGAILSVQVTMNFALMDTTSDAVINGDHSGEGMDSGDKALNKAKTAALKYFLQQTFLIPTGDDPEVDNHDVKGKTGKPAASFETQWNDRNGAASRPEPKTQPANANAPEKPPQRTPPQGPAISEAQGRRLFAIAHGNRNVIQQVIEEYGYQDSRKIVRADYEPICAKIEAEVNRPDPAPMDEEDIPF